MATIAELLASKGGQPWDVPQGAATQAPIDPAALQASMAAPPAQAPPQGLPDQAMAQAQNLAQRQEAVGRAAGPLTEAFQATPLGDGSHVAVPAATWATIASFLTGLVGGGR